VATIEGKISSLKRHIGSGTDEQKKVKSVSDEPSDAGADLSGLKCDIY
jgi:hypothetical protein